MDDDTDDIRIPDTDPEPSDIDPSTWGDEMEPMSDDEVEKGNTKET